MKRYLLATLLLIFGAVGLRAQVWHDASEFPLYGKADPETPALYQRLPAIEGLRPELVNLGKTSTGLYLRFRSDSPTLKIRWTSAGPRWMFNMVPVGTRGLDLYIHTAEGWKYAGSAKPAGPDKAASTSTVISNMQPQMREFMLYLSLYDGITSLEIGVDEGSSLLSPQLGSPMDDSPMVFYGTSILQGASASRPGLAFTNRLARRFDRTAINLGFSGNAFLDPEIARLMASVPDPCVYILDYVPNAFADMIDERGEAFFRILRDAHPDVPVIFVEDPIFPHSEFDSEIYKEISSKNVAQKRLYDKLRRQGEKHLYYISSDLLLQNEDTVDSIHPTDVGMDRYYRAYEKVLKKILRRK